MQSRYPFNKLEDARVRHQTVVENIFWASQKFQVVLQRLEAQDSLRQILSLINSQRRIAPKLKFSESRTSLSDGLLELSRIGSEHRSAAQEALLSGQRRQQRPEDENLVVDSDLLVST